MRGFYSHTEKTDTDDISDLDDDEVTVPAGNGILLEDVSSEFDTYVKALTVTQDKLRLADSELEKKYPKEIKGKSG